MNADSPDTDTNAANQLWGGRFASGPSSIMERINVSIGFDQRLAVQDIAGSKAHAAMLARQGIIAAADADKIIEDMPEAHVLHVVRNPWSAYADTKKRPKPMSLANYMTAWVTVQYHALLSREQFGSRVHIVRAEDVMANPSQTLGPVCAALGLAAAPSLSETTWNGEVLQEVFPWGTIRRATTEANVATARELSAAEQDDVALRAAHYLDIFDYKAFRRQLA